MGSLDDAVDGLREVLSRLRQIDLWPPQEVAQEIVNAVARGIEIASVPPRPHPDDVRAVAAAWDRIGQRWDTAAQDIAHATSGLDGPRVWEGEAGDACRRTTGYLAGRCQSVPRATSTARTTLTSCADAMEAARRRHSAAYDRLTRHLQITWTDLRPWELFDLLKSIVEDAIAAVEELLGAYQDAAVAVRRASAALAAAVDQIDLPSSLVTGSSVVDQINASGTGTATGDTGPLRGSVAARANDRLAALSPADRARVQAWLAAASGDEQRGWILATLASGVSLDTVGRFAAHLDQMSPGQLAALDPTTLPGVLRQPDSTTCGSSSLVVARMLNDPAYAMWVMTGYNPATDTTTGDPGAVPGDRHPFTGDPLQVAAHNRFAREALAMHDQTNGLTDHDGGFNGWWPQAAGTSPGSAARQMTGGSGASGVPGSSYDTAYIAPSNLDASYDRLMASANAGHAVPLYVGEVGGANGSGFHVVLVTGTRGDALTVYEPESGQVIEVRRDDFVNQRLVTAGVGWDKPMVAVVP